MVGQITAAEARRTMIYRACLAAGTHRGNSGRYTVPRVWAGLEIAMPICRTCQVPIPPVVWGTPPQKGVIEWD